MHKRLQSTSKNSPILWCGVCLYTCTVLWQVHSNTGLHTDADNAIELWAAYRRSYAADVISCVIWPQCGHFEICGGCFFFFTSTPQIKPN